MTGPNGAGKSTLALLLGGLLRPDLRHGRRVRRPGGRRTSGGRPTLARRIGSVFQNPEHQFVTSRVADELALGPRRLGRPDGRRDRGRRCWTGCG